jgi:hypothetical protein
MPNTSGGPPGRVWNALGAAYACVAVALHVVFGVLFSLGYGVQPWWFVTLMLLAWSSVWLLVVRLVRRQPIMLALLVLGADMAILLGFAVIADAVGYL